MKNEEVRMKNADDETAKPKESPRPESGADSQLYNYNVMLTRLGDLFDDSEEPGPQD
ncbi:MAG TPA: hypothetical protein VL282_00180 [Tepidisphaeraceae bacterium]|jgi:hypothetical protein|nr:hypothetical protein [Tepidisphaeraceae bacterium]